ncbi:MAG TPA: hypothetical protein VM183_06715 [Burkholderiales bacterium]|nr:hypothetical protein [Burkholderiales bacterium]
MDVGWAWLLVIALIVLIAGGILIGRDRTARSLKENPLKGTTRGHRSNL